MGKIILFKILFIIIFINILTSTFNLNTKARGIDLTLNGSYSNSYTSDYKYTRTSYGLDLGIPLGNYFELNIGHTITNDSYVYTTEYKNYLINKGNTLPAGDLIQEYNTKDTFSNLSVGLFNSYIIPSIFGGIVYRKIYFKDYYGTESTGDELTWNAGAALSIRLGRHIRLKISYNISPSGISSPSGSPNYNQSYLGGLTLVFWITNSKINFSKTNLIHK